MTRAEKLTQIAENEQKVYDAGKNAEYDAFWDKFQDNGNRVKYDFAFSGLGWTEENFKPKYNICPTTLYFAFRASQDLTCDLVEHLAKLGVTLDTSNSTTFAYCFYGSYIKRVGVLDISKATEIVGMLTNAYYLESVDELIVSANNSSFNNVLAYCSRLKNITISGEISGDNLNLQRSTELTHDSLMSIINALSENASGKTLTIGSMNIAKLTDEELDIVEQKGWNIQ